MTVQKNDMTEGECLKPEDTICYHAKGGKRSPADRMEPIITVREKLKVILDTPRYEHTLGVAYTAACMGMYWGEDPLTCELAGMLHDCAKNMTAEDLISGCHRVGIALSAEELASPQILHAIYGAVVAREAYGITDKKILSAIRFHTTGKANMTLLEKIIFIADFIEPLRSKAACLDEARKLAFQDIDRCMALILKETLNYLKESGKPVEVHTKEAYNYYG